VIVSCRRFVELVTEEWEGAVSSWERKHFHEHRETRDPCRRYLEGFERTVALLLELPREPAPEAMRAALLTRLRATRGHRG
jgi:hypothetical protein